MSDMREKCRRWLLNNAPGFTVSHDRLAAFAEQVERETRERIVVRLRHLAIVRDGRIGTPEAPDAAEPARFLAGVATIIETEE